MLETLRRIIHEVNGAPNLGQALKIIVESAREAIDANVCSVYLTDFDTQSHILRATVGLNEDAVGKVKLPLHRGLVGLVAERAEPVNVDEAATHPRYLFITETGETHYHGFLGVPIIQNRKVLGVLVARQKEPRRFGDEEVTFLFTLAAQLAGAIIHAQSSGELEEIQQTSQKQRRFHRGQPGSPGVAIGQVVVAYKMADLDVVPDRQSADIDKDINIFQQAVDKVIADIKRLKGNLGDKLPSEDQALFDALMMMLSSDTLVTRTIALIRDGHWVQGALRMSIEEHARVFDEMDDVYLRERASDVRDLGRRILMHLQSDTPLEIEYPENTVLVGDDVSAVQLAEVPVAKLAAIVSTTGSSSSHVAILARAFAVPAVMGVSDLLVGRMENQTVIADGYRGRVYLSPEPVVLGEYQRMLDEDRALSDELSGLQGVRCESTDGIEVPLYLNTGLVSDIGKFGVQESAGVGLYRTELPFMIRDRFPAEMIQISNYRRVIQAFHPRPVVLRTLDIGGDKPLPYFPIEESNPFLGWRGIRVSLDHPEIFLTQIRAILRADIGYHTVKILLPMVSNINEVDESLLLIQRALNELEEEGFAVKMPEVGVMIEVPSAVYQIEALARRVDFLSIGTNDLTQYLLAVDRNNSRVADLYNDMHPVVLRAIQQVVNTAKDTRCPVSVCGELAGNPLAAPLMLGLGVDSLSMSSGSLLKVKWVMRSFARSNARQLTNLALKMEDSSQVINFMQGALDDMGLGRLIRPGR
ncbi:MAG: phosphoenolpyruvate--protein phosphotransferase [Gammaproteobacteria bacterium]|nr:phosphoenolpyruvate--protein phosphotransferase [Gammaproteobacteria bacterium]